MALSARSAVGKGPFHIGKIEGNFLRFSSESVAPRYVKTLFNADAPIVEVGPISRDDQVCSPGITEVESEFHPSQGSAEMTLEDLHRNIVLSDDRRAGEGPPPAQTAEHTGANHDESGSFYGGEHLGQGVPIDPLLTGGAVVRIDAEVTFVRGDLHDETSLS